MIAKSNDNKAAEYTFYMLIGLIATIVFGGYWPESWLMKTIAIIGIIVAIPSTSLVLRSYFKKMDDFESPFEKARL